MSVEFRMSFMKNEGDLDPVLTEWEVLESGDFREVMLNGVKIDVYGTPYGGKAEVRSVEVETSLVTNAESGPNTVVIYEDGIATLSPNGKNCQIIIQGIK